MAKYAPLPYPIYRYCRIPKRRLISGFLTVNVVNSNANANRDDFNEWVYTNWTTPLSDEVQAASPFADDDNALVDSVFGSHSNQDPGRTGKKLSFGDYDCFLFWVVGGMSQHDPVTSGPAITDFTGYSGSDTTADAWYTSVVDPCQSFLKYHLVSRINNGYGYGAKGWTEDDGYYGQIAQARHSYLGGTGTGTSYIAPGNDNVATTRAKGDTMLHQEEGKYIEYLMSNGIYSAANHGDIDLDNDDENTFFPPVHFIDIYAIHYAKVANQTHTSNPTIYSMSAGGGYHDSSFWDLVVKVNLRGFDQSGSNGAADRVWFESNTNVFFQPFGETGNFNFGSSYHTS
jgi:hypothetical protein|tara:strand:- start:18 stop:1046 length:1029 start_codon:yes stop_codon:yes gene_type:complete